MNPKLRVWAPILVVLAVAILIVSIKTASADPSMPTAPAPRGEKAAYYTGEELEAAKAKGQSLPDPSTPPAHP